MESTCANRQEGSGGEINATAVRGSSYLAGGLIIRAAVALSFFVIIGTRALGQSVPTAPAVESSTIQRPASAGPEMEGDANGSEAFPADSKKVRVAKPKKQAQRKDRVTRRVKEPVIGKAPAKPKATEAPIKTSREMLGPVRAPGAVGAQSARGLTEPAGGEGRGLIAGEAKAFAPYGRLVKCELVFTIDSISLNTPIVALVMEDVWWNGDLIIPAGTEVFGRALADRVGNRIGDDGQWTFVLPEQNGQTNGRELSLKGFALDRSEVEVTAEGRVRAWSLVDGAPGLHGYVIDEANPEKIRLFIATALSGAVQGLSAGLQTRVPATGNAGRRGLSVVPATVGNAAISAVGEGVEDALALLGRQILDEVRQNGAYVRVPAGKAFYLFIDQTIDPGLARVGVRAGQASP